MKKILLTITFFSLSFISYANDQYDAQLNNLFNQLKSTGSSIAAKEIETKIWKMWTTHPSEESLTNLLAKGSYYMSQNQLTSAHNVFSKAIELDPKSQLEVKKHGQFEVKSSNLKEMSKIIAEVMNGVESSEHHKFTVPLLIDLNSGENWGLLH